MEKYFICSEEPNPKDDKKKYYHRIGELLKFETKAGGHFYKVKLFANPTAIMSVFKDEPKGAKGDNNPSPPPYDPDGDLPF